MTSVGDRLRQERLRQHLELRQISAELKISPRILEAIEAERFEQLPAGVFVKSFVRQYAHLLGLDGDEFVAGVEQLIEAPFALETLIESETAGNRAPHIHVPPIGSLESLRNRRFSWFSWMPAAALVIAVMLICSAVYSRWQRSHNAAAVQQSSASQQEPAAATPAPAVQEHPPATAETASPAQTSEPPSFADRAADSPAEPNANRSGSPAAVRVDLTAREKVWISAHADGKVLFSGMLAANETRTVEANDKVLLRVGNAGAVDVSLNGRSLGALGAKGQPRTVQFTSGGFQTVAVSRRSFAL